MFQKFKMTTSATLLSIGVFALPFAGNVTEVAAENCDKGTKQEIRECFKEIVKEFEGAVEEAKADIRKLKAERKEIVKGYEGAVEEAKVDIRKLKAERKEIVKGYEGAVEEAKADIKKLKAERDELHAARKKAMVVVTKMIKDEQSTLQAAQKLEKHGATFFEKIISDLRDAL